MIPPAGETLLEDILARAGPLVKRKSLEPVRPSAFLPAGGYSAPPSIARYQSDSQYFRSSW
jgi:hypothetical protein